MAVHLNVHAARWRKPPHLPELNFSPAFTTCTVLAATWRTKPSYTFAPLQPLWNRSPNGLASTLLSQHVDIACAAVHGGAIAATMRLNRGQHVLCSVE